MGRSDLTTGDQMTEYVYGTTLSDSLIASSLLPHREISIAAAGWRCGIRVTCQVSIGSDIFHGYPNANGAALGEASYKDFLIFSRVIQDLEGGVFLNIGSAVTGPEVYLKALSMARNVARQRGEQISNFTTGVFDVVELPENWAEGPGPPPQSGKSTGTTHPLYYFRPWKTILIRTIQDGGKSYYVCGDHRQTIPALWTLLTNPDGTSAGVYSQAPSSGLRPPSPPISGEKGQLRRHSGDGDGEQCG